MKKRVLKKFHRSETGAAAAEAAITIMTFLLVILGIMQLTLAINARLLVNYAAYCAARAGIVFNGDQNKMEQAAAVALTPLLAESREPIDLGIGYGKARISLAAGLLQVEKISPHGGTDRRFFPELTRYGEAPTGSDAAKLNDNLLTVKVTYYLPLEIPLINTILQPWLPWVPISATHQMRMQSDNQIR